MSYGGLDMEWLIMAEMLRLKENTDQELLDRIPRYKANDIQINLIENELSNRGTLDKYRKEYPELWI